mmetsp:Transcript_32713/g.76634  ORF Transcript_32713/g.76634 Transcript_32713/m.76634 type:complete len:490 (+) Transcript_32713:62-1531(+)
MVGQTLVPLSGADVFRSLDRKVPSEGAHRASGQPSRLRRLVASASEPHQLQLRTRRAQPIDERGPLIIIARGVLRALQGDRRCVGAGLRADCERLLQRGEATLADLARAQRDAREVAERTARVRPDGFRELARALVSQRVAEAVQQFGGRQPAVRDQQHHERLAVDAVGADVQPLERRAALRDGRREQARPLVAQRAALHTQRAQREPEKPANARERLRNPCRPVEVEAGQRRRPGSEGRQECGRTRTERDVAQVDGSQRHSRRGHRVGERRRAAHAEVGRLDHEPLQPLRARAHLAEGARALCAEAEAAHVEASELRRCDRACNLLNRHRRQPVVARDRERVEMRRRRAAEDQADDTIGARVPEAARLEIAREQRGAARERGQQNRRALVAQLLRAHGNRLELRRAAPIGELAQDLRRERLVRDQRAQARGLGQRERDGRPGRRVERPEDGQLGELRRVALELREPRRRCARGPPHSRDCPSTGRGPP